MQLPSPLGQNPGVLPSPVGPLSGFAGGGGSGVVGVILAADLGTSGAALITAFGAQAAASGKWVLQAGLYVTSQAAGSGGIAVEVISAGATGQVGVSGSGTSATQFGSGFAAPGALSPTVCAFDASASPFAFVLVTAGLITTGSAIDLQWKNITGGITYTLKAGSWLTLAKVG